MRQLEHIQAARDEAIRLGATFEIKKGGKHLIGVIWLNGKCRKTSISASPSRLACYQVIKYVRKAIKEMQG
jgi:hypothetical protein